MITPFPDHDAVAAVRRAGSGDRTKHPRPRVLFYSHDADGVGHLARILLVVREIAHRRPDAALLVITGSSQAHAFDAPPNLDFIRLPLLANQELFRSPRLARRAVPGAEPPRREDVDVWRLRAALTQAAAAAFAPDVVLVNHEPGGPRSELVPALETLHAARPRPAILFGLTDEFDDGPAVRSLWRRSQGYDLLDRVYDRILVYGCQEVFDPVIEYGLSPTAAAKAVFCGHLVERGPLIPAAAIRAEFGAGEAPLVIVAPGGGADGEPLLRAYLAAVQEPELSGLVSFVVAGPLLPADARAELEAIAGHLDRVTVVPFTKNLVSYYAAADLVVTMGGANNLATLLSLGKRVISVPRARPTREQLKRAECFAERGLLTLIHPFVLTPARLRDAIRRSMAAPPPTVDLDFDGVRRVGEEIGAAVDRRGL